MKIDIEELDQGGMMTDTMRVFNTDWIKPAVITKLQQQALDVNICPKCHTKTLADVSVKGLIADQCTNCLCVYIKDC